ncbi:restriction endonuclease subunit S [Bradyrhizobium sp. JYMT SZCCT0428]|uniref:restriction endonuclease subunit S n=1 Tax=Bradyrhizobium sp. JYMT SZCCT0428 TaxID=2807673 RepID=UPI001BAE2883|nr:restriction endonuclease subunit S [Bradyrhizobium sp. JYMT SZCCT0428]MBR1157092.1 restriction endonuclease subunit S [Bradyrhizobium sp. JYMT SZCCT0428]
MYSDPEWQKVLIRDVTLKANTWNPQTEFRNTIRYVDVSAISRDKLEIEGGAEISAATAPSRARKIIKRGDTIFATIRPGLKRVAKVPDSYDNQIASTAFCILRPDETVIDPDFLFFHASGDQFVEAVASFETGASYPAVRDSDILDRELLLPPLSVQKQIVRALQAVRDAMLLQISSLAGAEALKRAAMRSLFTHGMRAEESKETELGPVPESWEVSTVGGHFSTVSGGTPSRENAEYWTGGNIPWVKTTEVNYGLIDSTEECITAAGLANSAAKMLRRGTLLMAMYGQGVTRGRVAILGIEAACNQACAAINARDEAVLPTYLFHFLTYRYEAIRQMAHGGQQQNLNLEIVRDLLLVFPKDHQEQRDIVKILDAIDRKINLHKQKRVVVEDLFKALLRKLMTGEVQVAALDLSTLDRTPFAEVAA